MKRPDSDLRSCLSARLVLTRIVAVCGIALAVVACSHGSVASSDSTWDPKAAAAYLDRRMEYWIHWKGSNRDHGTFCVSCHTVVPYALARPALRVALTEPGVTAPERQLMDDVRRRVRLWHETSPFYTDEYVAPGKSGESRGTEAVLNALILAWDDGRTGTLSADTVTAFDHMWAEQRANGEGAGSWSWLNFDLRPWESSDAQFYGAVLAALAVGVAPEKYQSRADIQEHLRLLRDYLVRESPAQSLHHRVLLLWAASKLPGLMEAPERQSLVGKVLRAQNADGGWSLSALLRKSGIRSAALTYPHPESDGYATGLVTLVFGQAQIPGAAPQLQRGLSWLVRNQVGHNGSWIRGQEGFWIARSVNGWRNPWSNGGRFMSDAATAYAVLALTQASQGEPTVRSVQR